MIDRLRHIPEWLIDDTTEIGDARVFVCHTFHPRFIGELMPDDEHDPAGVTIAAPNGETLCRIEWIDDPAVTDDLIRSLDQAIEHHWSVRG